MSERRVVVTALGLRSAFPGGVKGFREGLMRGKTGLRKPGLVDGEAFGIPLAGEVSDSVRQWPGLEGDRKAGLLLEALEDMKGSGALPPIDGCWLGSCRRYLSGTAEISASSAEPSESHHASDSEIGG